MKKSVLTKIFVAALTIALCFGILAACVDTGNYDISNVSVTRGSVSWTPIPEAESYKIEIGGNTYTSTSSKLDVTGIEPGTYAVTITPVVNGESKKASTKTIAIPPSQSNPLHIKTPATTFDPATLTLSWTEAANAEAYVLNLYKTESAESEYGEDDIVYTNTGKERSAVLPSSCGAGHYAVTVTATSPKEHYVASNPAETRYEITKLASVLNEKIALRDGRLEWNAVDDASYYELTILFGGEEQTGSDGKRYTSTGASFAFSDYFDSYGTYSVKITAHNGSAAVLSSDESEGFASISYTKLDTPSDVKVEESTTDGTKIAVLKWNRISQDQADGNIEYFAAITANDVKLEFSTTDNFLTLDDRLTLSRKYSVEVYAVDKLKRFTASDRSAKVEYSTAAVLDAPTLAFDKTNMKLNWNAVANAQGYELRDGSRLIYTGNAVEYAVPATFAAGAHDLKVRALGNGHEYLDSDYSAIKTVTKLAMPYVTGILSNIVNWSESVGADSYEITLTDRSGNEIRKSQSGRGYDIADINAGEYTIAVGAFSTDADTINSDKGAYVGKVVKLASDDGSGISVRDGKLIIPVAGDALAYIISIPELGSEFSSVRVTAAGGAVEADIDSRFFSDDYLPNADSCLTIRIVAEGDGKTLISSSENEAGKIYRLRSVTELKMTTGYVLKWTDGANIAQNPQYRIYYGENVKKTVADKFFGVGTEAGEIGVDGAPISVSAYVDNGVYSKNFRLESNRDTGVSVSRLATPYVTSGERRFEWNPVEGVSGYSVTMRYPDGTVSLPKTQVETFWAPDSFPEEGEYVVSVTPVGNNIDVLDGGAGTIKHNVTKLIADAGAEVRDGKLYFDYTDAADYDETYTVVLNGVTEAADVKFSPYNFTGKFERNNTVLLSVNGDNFRYLSSEQVSINFEIVQTVLETPVVERVLNDEGKAALSWQNVLMASEYELVFTKDGQSPVTLRLASDVTNFDLRRFYEYKSDAEGLWKFTVKAVGKGDFILNSEASAEAEATFTAAPTDAKVEKNKLKWTSSVGRYIVKITQNGVTTEFFVEVAAAAENAFDLRSELSAGEYTATVAAAATENSVEAVDSAPAAAVSGRKLAAVTGVTAKNNGLNWNPVDGATKYNYKVENSVGDIISESTLTIAGDKTEPSINFPFVSSGRVFGYVTAINDEANNIESDDSAKLEFGKLSSPDLSSIYVYDNVLHWENVAGAKNYKVTVTDKDGKNTNYTVPATENKFKLDLKAGEYTINIVAVGDGGSTFDSSATNDLTYKSRLSIPKNIRYDNKILYWENPDKKDYDNITFDLTVNGVTVQAHEGTRLVVVGGNDYKWNENGTNVVTIKANKNSAATAECLEDSDIVDRIVECAIFPVLSFETFGGTVIGERTFKYNAIPTKPADPQKTNYKFAGWFSDRDCATAYGFDAAITADMTIYAKWLKVIDYVTFGKQFDRKIYERLDTIFDPAGGELLVYYKDGSSEKIPVSADMVADFGQYTQTIGRVNVTLVYKYDEAEYPVQVEFEIVEKVDKIELTTAFDKQSYFIGDKFDPTGGLITVTYADAGATTESVEVTANMVEFDSSTAGDSIAVMVTFVHYGVKYTCQTTVKVVKKAMRIELKQQFTKTLYFIGEAFEPAGGKITVHYNDNSTEDVNVTADMISGFVSSAPNTALLLTITYTKDGVANSVTTTVAVEYEVTGITLSTDFAKKTYTVGETFDPAGGRITISHANGAPNTIIAVTSAMVTGFQSTTANSSLTVTITFTQGTRSFTATSTLVIQAATPTP